MIDLQPLTPPCLGRLAEFVCHQRGESVFVIAEPGHIDLSHHHRAGSVKLRMAPDLARAIAHRLLECVDLLEGRP